MTYIPRAGRKQHIGRDGSHAFCGNPIAQTKKGVAARLVVGSPEFCTCSPCLTNYYLQNPLTEKRTQLAADKRAAYLGRV